MGSKDSDSHQRHPGERPVSGSQASELGKWAEAWLYRGSGRLRVPLAGLLAQMRRGEHIFMVVLAVLIGVLGGYGAIAFRYMIYFFQEVFFSTVGFEAAQMELLPLWRRLLMPSLGGLVVGIIAHRLAPEVRGSGIPEVMEAVAKRIGVIRLRVMTTKALAAALTIGSGGSAGREGPIVHIGSSMGSTLGQFLQVPARRLQTFVACGAAAAVAATFNAPIAGALFSMEVVLGDLQVANLSPIVIAAVMATVVSRHHLGDTPAFKVPAFSLVAKREMALYAGLGLVAGLVSAVFIRLLHGVGDLFEETERWRVPPWIRPAMGGLLVGVIGSGLPQVYGVGYETINASLWGQASTGMLATLLAAKMLATALTIGSGGSGGIFAPSLFTGAVLGCLWGQLAQALLPGHVAGVEAYALVGMGGMVSGTTRAPISAILMIFELTNEYRIIAPLMLTCVGALLVSARLNRESIYTEKLVRRGVRLSEGKDVNVLRTISVRDVIEEAPTVPAELPFSELVPRILAGSHLELLVVDREDRLVGTLALGEIKGSLHDADALSSLVVAADVANRKVPFVLPDDNLDLVAHLFGRTHRDELPVCSGSRSRKVLGVVTRDALIQAYNRSIFQADLAGGFGSLVDAVRGGRTVEVLGGLQLSEVQVPSEVRGKTLEQANFRRRYNVEVVLIHTAETQDGMEGRPARMPTPQVLLEPGDRLLVIGTAEAVSKLQE